MTTTPICVCVMASLIVCFDFLTGMLEYFLEGSPNHLKMVRIIYKELMQMGLTSFLYLFYDSIPEKHVQWENSVDFSDTLLFFIAIFFVVHAFYIMRTSISTSKLYFAAHNLNTSKLLEQWRNQSFYDMIVFKSTFLPISQLRRNIEFKIIHILFLDTFIHFPKEFDFALYLSKCFEDYALRVIGKGLFSWFIVVVLLTLNYLRVIYQGPFVCQSEIVPGLTNKSDPDCYYEILLMASICSSVVCLYLFVLYGFGMYYERR